MRISLLVLASLLLVSAGLHAQEWPYYGGDAGGGNKYNQTYGDALVAFTLL